MIKSLSSLVASLLLAVAGCGGHSGGGATGGTTVPVAEFVGRWSGTYALVGQSSQAGTVALTVAVPDPAKPLVAVVSGTVVSSEFGAGTVSGTVDTGANAVDATKPAAAFFTSTYATPQDPAGAAQDDLHECDATIDARGHLILKQVHVTSGIYFANETFDLSPVATP